MNPQEELPLAGFMEICQFAGVQRSVVTMWRKRHIDFPTPVSQLHTGPVFWMPFVTSWLQNTGRQTNMNWSVEQVRATREFPR